MTLSARFLHLVLWSRSIRAGWLDRRGLWGHCVCMERCAERTTFPGNSCQIHRSRAEDRRADPARPNPRTRLIGVDCRGVGVGCTVCNPRMLVSRVLMGGHTEPLDGGLSTQAAYCLRHCSSLLFPPMQIPCTAVQSTQPQQWPGTPALSRCQLPIQCLSMVHHWA